MVVDFFSSSSAFWTNGSFSRLMFSRFAWMCGRICLSSIEKLSPSVVRPFSVCSSQIRVLMRAVISGLLYSDFCLKISNLSSEM